MACNDLRSHITESRFYRHGYTTDECRRLFCHYRRLQRWLDVEAALAASQAELGLIPAEAAQRLAETADLSLLSLDAIAAGIQQSGHSLIPLLDAWQRAAGDAAGRYIHYGATTQDIQDTAQTLEVRDGLRLIERDLAATAGSIVLRIAQFGDTVMIGRTHNQPALPTTFGLKAAGWLDELLRHLERLDQCRSRLLVSELFGGVGTMASFGGHGLELLARFSDRLGLAAPLAAWHASRDRLAELVGLLALITGTLARIANEISQLSRFEIGELEEPFHYGKIGSTTMPHKRNPELCEQVVVLSRLVKSQAAAAMDTLVSEHERDYRAVRMEWAAVTDAFLYSCGALRLMQQILAGLQVHGERMEANATRAGELLASESLMFRLAEAMGKQQAHALLYRLAMEAVEKNVLFSAALLDNPDVRRYFDEAALLEILRPEKYTGQAREITAVVVARAATILADRKPAAPAPCRFAGDDGRCRLDSDPAQ
ncbi:MAG: adenylosuccinate lyase family protein [Thermodesulfobacteriota bacterium]